MAAKKRKSRQARRSKASATERSLMRRLRRRLVRAVAYAAVFLLAWIALYAFVNPPGGIYILNEHRRLGAVERQWVPMERIAPVMARSVVAAEDANFCLHWGFDMSEIRRALGAGGARGASTLTQQTTKNVFLWHGRSWPRKALEAGMTPLVELLWSKRRILEVYLNIAEFSEGVFGVEAAAQHYFGVSAERLTPVQAALLAAVLPDPKGRDAARPSAFVQRRAVAIADGAATIALDGRSGCFE